MIKWRTRWGKIERVEIERETPHFVFVVTHWSDKRLVNKKGKDTGWQAFHDTWEEAYAALLEKVGNELESARLNLARIQGRYGQIKGMKKPEEA